MNDSQLMVTNCLIRTCVRCSFYCRNAFTAEMQEFDCTADLYSAGNLNS